MRTSINALLGAALLSGTTIAHTAIKPPSPDRALTPNSSVAPPGCKYLASDKGFPADDVWKKAFPGVYKKLKGTEAPDYMVQAKSVKDVQDAVNFARENNVRLTIITTGHDFGGRETGRSGLRLDLAALREPTVFAQDWKCGDTLQPTNAAGKVARDVQACKVKKNKRSFAKSIPGRDYDFKFFEKRDGHSCDQLIKLAKRHGPDGDAPMAAAPAAPMGGMEGMEGHAVKEVPKFNVIKPIAGRNAYARISAGVYNEMFFNMAHESGLMTAGAQHGGVSVLGGWAQAGGHNPFVNKIGMQVDNIVELEVVTADGKFQKVSECNNPELFWALRGGGGSTFAVVTGGTVKVHPTFPVVVSRFFVNSTNVDGVMEATAYFLQQADNLREKHGLQGYFYVYPGGFQSVLHMPDNYATLENAKKATEPLMAEMERIAGAKHIAPQYYQHKSYKAWYEAEMGNEEMEETGAQFLSWYDGSDGSVPAASDAMMNPLIMIPWAMKFPAGAAKRSLKNPTIEGMAGAVARSQAMARTYLDSRLLSNKHVNSVPMKTLAKAVKATFPMTEGNHVRGFLYGGGAQSKPDKDAMGLNPAWRDAVIHYIINAVPGNIRHDYNIGPIAKLFPDAGGYVNEAAPGEVDWKRAYWGDHYPKLEAIKRKVDPTNVFWCSPCVGADLLTYDDERLCKNAAYPSTGPAPQTYPNKNTTIGIAAMPGGPGIPNPLLPIIRAYVQNKTLPTAMPPSSFFKIAMGDGGSAGGKYADMDPYNPGQKLSFVDTDSQHDEQVPKSTGAKGTPKTPGAKPAGGMAGMPKPAAPKPAADMAGMPGMAGMAGMADMPKAAAPAAPASAAAPKPAADMAAMPGMAGMGGMAKSPGAITDAAPKVPGAQRKGRKGKGKHPSANHDDRVDFESNELLSEAEVVEP